VRWQFNHAVSALGRFIEGKIKETDDKGRHKHTIEELLGLPLVNKTGISGGMK